MSRSLHGEPAQHVERLGHARFGEAAGCEQTFGQTRGVDFLSRKNRPNSAVFGLHVADGIASDIDDGDPPGSGRELLVTHKT